MGLKGVIVKESLVDPKVLNEVTIIKTETEKVTTKHRTPWLSVWTMLTIEVPEENMDEICEKIQKSLDKEHEWYVDLKSNRYEITIFNDQILKKKVFKYD